MLSVRFSVRAKENLSLGPNHTLTGKTRKKIPFHGGDIAGVNGIKANKFEYL